MKHLESDHIDTIALRLDEDMRGANGDLSKNEIHDRLMQAIVGQCNHHMSGVCDNGIDEDFIPMSVEEHAYRPALTLYQAASLILDVWEYKERQWLEGARWHQAFRGRVKQA
jgi:hypothetical protein